MAAAPPPVESERVRVAPALLAALLAVAASAARGEGAVQTQATLHLRTTTTRDMPGTLVLFDRQLRTFDIDGYLLPDGGERHGSVFASLRAEGKLLGGDVRWVLAADTGEVRRRAFPRIATVCLRPTGSTTGLAVLGSGQCAGATGIVDLEETRLEDPVLTSNGRTVHDELRKTLLLREAYAAWSFGKAGFATLRAGRKRTAIGDGFVHDDYATGVELGLDLGAIGPRWDVSLGLFQPTRDFPSTVSGISPVAVARADFLPSLFEHAGVFVAALRDRTGSVGELVRGSAVEARVGALARALGTPLEPVAAELLARTLAAPLESDAALGWAGTSGSLAPFRGQRLGWTLAVQGGTLRRLSTTTPAGTEIVVQDVPLRGRLLSVRSEQDVGQRLTAGAFFLYLSGSEPLARGRSYDAFLGISPFVTATNLFFGGGLSDTFAARQATAPGVNGRGVVAPGVSLTFDPGAKVSVQGRAAWLRSDVAGPYGGKRYGTEADLDVTWAPRAWLLFGLELDALWPGDFYAGRATVYKTVFAVDLVTP